MELDFFLLSNGVFIFEKVVKILKEKDLRVAVSLDGLEKYNDLQRVFPSGLGSFKFVEKGIENLLKAKVHFNITVIITKKNVKNISELTSYLLKHNIPFAFNFYRKNPYVF
jgi:sulfatase maturation enzyme AslB (radical SAM superfamily)